MLLPCVLIAADDLAIRGFVRIVLHRDRFDVDEAVNGDHAMARIRNKRFDVVVLDLMPGPGTDFDVLRLLNDQRPGEKCVVIISATTQRAMDNLQSENIFAKFRKPFDINELRGAVRQCCEH